MIGKDEDPRFADQVGLNTGNRRQLAARANAIDTALRARMRSTDAKPAGIKLGKRVGEATAAPKADRFETHLEPDEESNFRVWKQKYAPNDSGADYDLRGAFKAGLRPSPKNGHWPDTFKKPNHETFSVESKYAKDAPNRAGHWEGDIYVTPDGRRISGK